MLSAALDWVFRDRTSGRIVIGQWSNPPLWLFGLVQALARNAPLFGYAKSSRSNLLDLNNTSIQKRPKYAGFYWHGLIL